MTPPTCPITGKHLRYILLTAIFCYLIYFLYDGISADPTVTNVVYICNTGEQMIHCDGLDDATTCSSYLDADGQEATCIESSCGYKLFNHIDISIAGSDDPFDEEGATSTTSFLTVMAVFYSLVPYAIGFFYLVAFLGSGSLVPLLRFLVFGFIAVLNEVVFKRLVQQPRPEGSCLYFKSYGMPSGHAETSIGLLTYILLEAFIYHPNILCGLTCQKQSDANLYNFELGFGWIRTSPGGMEEPLQSEGNDEETGELDNTEQLAPIERQIGTRSKWFCHYGALFFIILLLPVPFSRVYLHDHYRNQVMIGSVIGIGVSLLAYLGLMRGLGLYGRMSKFASSEWGRWWGVKTRWDFGIL